MPLSLRNDNSVWTISVAALVFVAEAPCGNAFGGRDRNAPEV